MTYVRIISFQIIFFILIYGLLYTRFLKKHLSKLHVKRWIVFLAMAAVIFIPKLIEIYFKYKIFNSIGQYIQSGIFIILFVWFLDLKGGYIYKSTSNQKQVKKNSVIKPKAKPNRMKKYKKM